MMVFYYLGGNHIFALRSFMWLAHKPVHIRTPIGRGEPDLVQPSILGGPRSLVINGLGYFPKKEPTPCVLEYSHQGFLKNPHFTLQKTILSILAYHFTSHLASYLLFLTSHPTLFISLSLSLSLSLKPTPTKNKPNLLWPNPYQPNMPTMTHPQPTTTTHWCWSTQQHTNSNHPKTINAQKTLLASIQKDNSNHS